MIVAVPNQGWISFQVIAFFVVILSATLAVVGGSLLCVFSNVCPLDYTITTRSILKFWVPLVLVYRFAGVLREMKEKWDEYQHVMGAEGVPHHRRMITLKFALAAVTKLFYRTYAVVPALIVAQFDNVATTHCVFALFVLAPLAKALYKWSLDPSFAGFVWNPERHAGKCASCDRRGTHQYGCHHVFCSSCFVTDLEAGKLECPHCASMRNLP